MPAAVWYPEQNSATWYVSQHVNVRRHAGIRAGLSLPTRWSPAFSGIMPVSLLSSRAPILPGCVGARGKAPMWWHFPKRQHIAHRARQSPNRSLSIASSIGFAPRSRSYAATPTATR